jgi:FtsH-binding integral membrane protein
MTEFYTLKFCVILFVAAIAWFVYSVADNFLIALVITLVFSLGIFYGRLSVLSGIEREKRK